MFFAAGMSEPLCSHACAIAFRKVCEDATEVMHEPASLEMLMWIGEVSLYSVDCSFMLQYLLFVY